VLTESGLYSVALKGNGLTPSIGYVQSGSGLYGVLNETFSTGSVGPVVSFNQNMNINLTTNTSQPIDTAELQVNSSAPAPSQILSGGVLHYTVNSPGFLYAYFEAH